MPNYDVISLPKESRVALKKIVSGASAKGEDEHFSENLEGLSELMDTGRNNFNPDAEVEDFIDISLSGTSATIVI